MWRPKRQFTDIAVEPLEIRAGVRIDAANRSEEGHC